MKTITLIFTKSPWSPISWLIRWALPRSRFAFSLSSHCLIVDSNDPSMIYEADFKQGVRRIDIAEALIGCIVVKQITYAVPNAILGMVFLENQLGKKYDLKGALGLGLNPYRNWGDDNQWFCYELGSGALRAAGLDIFEDLTHVSETALLSIKKQA